MMISCPLDLKLFCNWEMGDYSKFDTLIDEFKLSIEMLLLKPWPKPGLILNAAEHVAEAFFFNHLIHLLALKVIRP